MNVSKLRSLALLGAFLLFMQLPTTLFAEVSADEGEKLFKQNCTSCHQLGKKLIGPNLVGITEEHDEEWLIKFIRNSQELIKAGDPDAVEVYEEYNQTVMPAMALSDDEIRSILSYIDREGEAMASSGAGGGSSRADKGGATAEGKSFFDEPLGKFLLLSVLLLIVGIIILLLRLSDLTSRASGKSFNWQKANVFIIPIFAVLFFGGIIYESFIHTGPAYLLPEAASVHGKQIDRLFNVTLIITGIVFVLTQLTLFFFAVKYREKKGTKSLFYPDNGKLELIWTLIPAMVLTVLVLWGFQTWQDVNDEPQEDAHIVEVFAYQFGWQFRYPGPDGKLGRTDYRLISAENPLGLDPDDPASKDDIIVNDELRLPVDRQVIVKLRSRDVIHSFFLPHFRAQMYCQPGLKTQFKFTPDITTAEMRQKLEGVEGREDFEYELVCNQICGSAHYNMRRVVTITEADEYNDWYEAQVPFMEKNDITSVDVELADKESK